MSSGWEPGVTRVLVVDDVPAIRECLMKLLALESDILVVGAAPDGRLAIEAAIELEPDVVLMDITMPGMDGIAAAEVIHQRCPGVQVIMMSVNNQPEDFRRAMVAGAREFLVKPFATAALVTAIRRMAVVRAQEQQLLRGPTVEAPSGRAHRIVSVQGPRGGVGRTTVACNLAVALHRAHGARVALVDASLHFGDVGLMLNLQPTKTILDLVPHIAAIDAELIADVVINHHSGVDVLLAPDRPELAELVTADYLKQILVALREIYDVVVVDTPASVSEPVVAALDVSDEVVVLLTTEAASIKNTRLLLAVAAQLGYPLEKLRLVLNRFDPGAGVEPGEVEAVLDRKIDLRVPLDNALFGRGLDRGEPILLVDAKAPATRALNRLAGAVLGAAPEPVAAPGLMRGGLLAGLSKLRRVPGQASFAAAG